MIRKRFDFKKSFISCFFLIAIFFIVGCSNKSEEVYNSSIQKGLDNLAAENYDKAIVSFEIALEEKADDKRAEALKLQTETYVTALKSFEDRNLDLAKENAESVKTTKNGSEALIKKSNEIIEKINLVVTTKTSYQEQYDSANSLFKDEKYSEALEKVTTLLQQDSIDDSQYASLKKSSKELEKSINEEIDNQTLADTEADKKNEVAAEEPSDPIEAYNELDQSLKVLLATTTVDERAMSPNLEGYNLYYNFDEGYLLTNVHSGVGSGHPWFIIEYDESTITPVEGVVYMGGGTNYDDVSLDSSPISKKDLYNRYINSKDSYDAAVEKVDEVSEMTMSQYEEMRSYINH
ncbi:outer membrane protein assembly factor BamD [Carnobacterium mobile]|uniref:hypothetical protein n=1 Tax=Carnobacterium mobile TaxID=2750 RepID=UPI000551AB98|nr:hypothetical protein [Carnobacterium mobile]